MTEKVKPLLRGHFHQAAFFIALGACALLLPDSKESSFWPNFIYSICVLSMFGFSALYHRPTWPPEKRQFMGRLDHCGIYLMIAGTFTPMCYKLSPESAQKLLFTIWTVAALGILQSLFGKVLPKWAGAVVYVIMGWLIFPYVGELRETLTSAQVTLIVIGGILYTVGAIAYALKRPKLNPRYFSYHEVFHLLVILAAVAHFIVIHDISQKS